MHKKKATGGIKRPWRGKRAYEAGGEPVETTLGKVKQRRVGIRGGAQKIRLASADWAVVTDKSTGKSSKSKLLRVVKNPANVDYQRRGDRKSTRLNSSHSSISYAVFCLKKKK